MEINTDLISPDICISTSEALQKNYISFLFFSTGKTQIKLDLFERPNIYC